MKKWSVFGNTLVAMVLVSCAPKFVHIAQQSCAEATALKNVCATLKQDRRERSSADSLYNQGATLIRTGHYEKAYGLLSRVIVNYRLILLRYTIAVKEREIDSQKRQLDNEQKELSDCRKIMSELSPPEKP